MKLFLLSATLTLGCYIWLALPPHFTKTPIPAIISFATGHGFSPCEPIKQSFITEMLTRSTVLLVVVVPRIVPLKYVSTTLGAHKAVRYYALALSRYSAYLHQIDSSNKQALRFSRLSLDLR